ncbi:MAG: short-chain dehydrogenase/reductase SDR, partial [uncultured bacterium]
MNLDLNGKRVVITAGAQGIGLAIVEAFVAAGAQVHICDVNDDFLASAKQKLPQVSQSRTDVSSESQVNAMFADLAARWGGLD